MSGEVYNNKGIINQLRDQPPGDPVWNEVDVGGSTIDWLELNGYFEKMFEAKERLSKIHHEIVDGLHHFIGEDGIVKLICGDDTYQAIIQEWLSTGDVEAMRKGDHE